MDKPSEISVTLFNSYSMPLKNTGSKKHYFTVVLSAKANGTKLKPSSEFKGKSTGGFES